MSAFKKLQSDNALDYFMNVFLEHVPSYLRYFAATQFNAKREQIRAAIRKNKPQIIEMIEEI